MSYPVRKFTIELLTMMDEGLLDPRIIAEAALMWLTDDEVADMARANDLFSYPYGDEDDVD